MVSWTTYEEFSANFCDFEEIIVKIELQRIIQNEFNFPGNFFLLYVDKTYEGTLYIKRIFLMNF